VFRGGHPQLNVSAAYDAKRRVATFSIDQKQPVDEQNPAFIFDVEVGLSPQLSVDRERRIRVHVERVHETVTIPLDFEPKLVRFDPGAYILGDVTYQLGVDFAVAALEADPSVVARIRAARELAKDGSAAARSALARIFERDTFWGVLAETAHAVGDTRAPWARELLARSLSHPHPKVRRAVADSIGSFRDESVATGLIALAQYDASYFVQAAALHSLGKTRDARAFDVLREAVGRRTWNGVVESGAAYGLGELADARATTLLVEAAKLGKDEALRRAALTALSRHGELVDSERRAAIDAIAIALDDPMFMVQRQAIHAAEHLADRRFLHALDRLSASAFDGRIRRDAAEAAMRIRESQKVPAQVTGLRTDVDALREEQRKIQEKIEALSRP
jgi:aminopeptidase N